MGQNTFSYLYYDWWQYSNAVVHELTTTGELSLTNQTLSVLQQRLVSVCGMQRKDLETLGPLHVGNLNIPNEIAERTI